MADLPYPQTNEEMIAHAKGIGTEITRAVGMGASLLKGKLPSKQEALDEGESIKQSVKQTIKSGFGMGKKE